MLKVTSSWPLSRSDDIKGKKVILTSTWWAGRNPHAKFNIMSLSSTRTYSQGKKKKFSSHLCFSGTSNYASMLCRDDSGVVNVVLFIIIMWYGFSKFILKIIFFIQEKKNLILVFTFVLHQITTSHAYGFWYFIFNEILCLSISFYISLMTTYCILFFLCSLIYIK